MATPSQTPNSSLAMPPLPPQSATANDKRMHCKVREKLQRAVHRRAASLTNVEKSFLSKLLIDTHPTIEEENRHKKRIEKAIHVLSDDVLFSVPIVKVASSSLVTEENKLEGDEILDGYECHNGEAVLEKNMQEAMVINSGENDPLPPKPSRSNESQLDLWKAHQDGVPPIKLRAMSSLGLNTDSPSSNNSTKRTVTIDTGSGTNLNGGDNNNQYGRRRSRRSSRPNTEDDDCDQDIECNLNKTNKSKSGDEDDANSLDAQSDQEVGHVNDESSASSWDSSQGGFDHYDAWEVIKDEYAEDFGFNVAVENDDTVLPCAADVDGEDDQRGIFKILGTSSEDIRAVPHVLSPPLMDSLLNFVPERFTNDNFWLKFSLIRDGASLDILRRYCRAATHTILAIETTNGEVFGSFTSAPWRLNNKYFGTGESFLWRMRHNRNTPVHSLFEQAQLESEIDIFPFNGSNDYIQLCTMDKIALGGGSLLNPGADSNQADNALGTADVYLEWNDYGFGLALDENLLHGTTSPSATFGNSSLVSSSNGGECFDVMNLEVYTLTSAETERQAEQSEMSMFFVRESISSLSKSPGASSSSSLFSAEDLDRASFYRRIGDEDDDTDRNAWQYSNMMNPMAGNPYGMMK